MGKRNGIGLCGVIVLTPLITFGLGGCASEQAQAVAEAQKPAAQAVQSTGVQAPQFEVDPFWPKFPKNTIIGKVLGISPDAQNNVWILQRADAVHQWRVTNAKEAPPDKQVPNRELLGQEWVKSAIKSDGSCCSPFPSFVLQFDQAGNLLSHWGPSPGYQWPYYPHGLEFDHKGNIWIASNVDDDSRILKFSKDGKFLMQIGTRGVRGKNNDTKNLGSPGSASVDPTTNEVYVSDGSTNRRIIVFDADTGAYKRHWGAYGKPPREYEKMTKDGLGIYTYDPNGPPPDQFNSPHCAKIAKDGLVYVCDWHNNRVQVFKKDGTFVKETFVAKQTRRGGTVWGVAISRDPEEKYLYVSDGANRKVRVLRRDTLEELYSFGQVGRQPGQFYGEMHNINTDLSGNLYLSETGGGNHVQRFLYKGEGPIASKDEGVLWPVRSTQ